MAAARPRIDLDGVALYDGNRDPERNQMVICVFRKRTRQGLVLLVPESAEVLVSWEHIRSAEVDLASAEVRVELAPDYVDREHWLRQATHLAGSWTDRLVLDADKLGLTGD